MRRSSIITTMAALAAGTALTVQMAEPLAEKPAEVPADPGARGRRVAHKRQRQNTKTGRSHRR